jgi:phytoene synthase
MTTFTGTSGLTWAAAQKHTDKVIQQHSKTFYLATSLLPHIARDSIRALYGFCRSTDDLVDQENATIEMVEEWRRQVSLPLHQQKNPILWLWGQIKVKFHVNTQYEQELIDGVQMDIEKKEYETWDELENYCYKVASTVGLLSIPIVGLAPNATFDHAATYAIKLGIALQLTNILRDIGEDLLRGRVYLPVEDLKQFNLTLKDIHNHVKDERFFELMKFQIKRARTLYAEALPGIKLLSSSGRVSVGAAALLYKAILDEIEKINYQVYDTRAFTTGFRKIRMLPGIAMQIWHLPTPSP